MTSRSDASAVYPKSVAAGGTGDTGSAWATYDPSPSAGGSGFAWAAHTTAGRYKQIGKTVFFCISVTLTTAGSGGGGLVLSLPVGNLSNISYQWRNFQT